MPSSAVHKKAFAAAREKLRLAKSKLEAMRQAKSLDELSQLWSEFLTEQHRVFLRLKKATEHGAGKGWFDQITNEQRTDELLRYNLHARDAAEHGIEKITEDREVGIGINMGGNSFRGKHMRIDAEPGHLQISGDPELINLLSVNFYPAEVGLVAVLDRGKVYQPPSIHRDKPIEKLSPVLLAELTIAYLEEKMIEAEAKYVK